LRRESTSIDPRGPTVGSDARMNSLARSGFRPFLPRPRRIRNCRIWSVRPRHIELRVWAVQDGVHGLDYHPADAWGTIFSPLRSSPGTAEGAGAAVRSLHRLRRRWRLFFLRRSRTPSVPNSGPTVTTVLLSREARRIIFSVYATRRGMETAQDNVSAQIVRGTIWAFQFSINSCPVEFSPLTKRFGSIPKVRVESGSAPTPVPPHRSPDQPRPAHCSRPH
jgi:hypothetical protein